MESATSTKRNVVNLNAVRTRQQRALDTSQSILRVVVELYSHCTLDQFELAMLAANKVLDAGGDFIGAMDAVDKVLDPEGKLSVHNKNLIAKYSLALDEREIQRERLQEIAQLRIMSWMRKRREPEISAAVTRARRVLDGGGTLGRALYHAINPVLDGPEAA